MAPRSLPGPFGPLLPALICIHLPLIAPNPPVRSGPLCLGPDPRVLLHPSGPTTPKKGVRMQTQHNSNPQDEILAQKLQETDANEGARVVESGIGETPTPPEDDKEPAAENNNADAIRVSNHPIEG